MIFYYYLPIIIILLFTNIKHIKYLGCIKDYRHES